jgi:hypothetical protein
LPPLLIAAAFGLVASEVMATHTVTEVEDIRNTKHNMTRNPDIKGGAASAGQTMTEVCIFCHTPHGAHPDLTGMAPLWNRNVPDDLSYTPYEAPNFDASGLSPGIPKGVSLACLSCHDGTIALDALINGPGSGGFTVANRGIGGGSSIDYIGFTGGLVDVNSSLSEGPRGPDEGFTVSGVTGSPFTGGIHDTVTDGSGAPEGGQFFPNLGRNLSDDHPIGMQIPAAGFVSDPGGTIDPQFSLIGLNSRTSSGTDDGTVKFITKILGNYPEDKRDRIRAYPSNIQNPAAYYVECASCHNPHTPRVSFLRLPSGQGSITPLTPIPNSWNAIDGDGGGAGLLWAQRPNSGSAVCLSCHQK